MKAAQHADSRGKRYTREFKQECVNLMTSGSMTWNQIVSKKKVSKESLRRWVTELAANAPPAEQTSAQPSAPESVPAPKNTLPVKADSGRWSAADKARVLAMVTPDKTIAEVAAEAGIPVGTIYGWRAKEARRNALVAAEPQRVEVQSPGVTAVISAAQTAMIWLKQARKAKKEAIRAKARDDDEFTDDFCYGQIAYNQLARVLGTK